MNAERVTVCNTLCKDLDRKIMKVTNELVKRVGTLRSVTHNEGMKPMNTAVVKRVVTLLSVTHNEGTKPMNTAVVKKGGGYSYFLFTAMLGRLCRRRITN